MEDTHAPASEQLVNPIFVESTVDRSSLGLLHTGVIGTLSKASAAKKSTKDTIYIDKHLRISTIFSIKLDQRAHAISV